MYLCTYVKQFHENILCIRVVIFVVLIVASLSKMSKYPLKADKNTRWSNSLTLHLTEIYKISYVLRNINVTRHQTVIFCDSQVLQFIGFNIHKQMLIY